VKELHKFYAEAEYVTVTVLFNILNVAKLNIKV